MENAVISARWVFIIMVTLRMLYDAVIYVLDSRQRRKPLPSAVEGIYDAERYKIFLSREMDIDKAYLVYSLVYVFLEILVIFSPLFGYIEKLASGNVYGIYLLTSLIYCLVGSIADIPYEMYRTFVIDGKYGLNKKSMREFFKDEIISKLTAISTEIGIMLVLIYCGEHMAVWTSGFEISSKKLVAIEAAIALVLVIILVLVSLLHVFLLKKRYTFTALPDGELKDKIYALLAGCKKKVHAINIYDESKKSVRKNAFLLKFLWYREFGIADNFLDENSEGELLAVLSHEIGHLKHKKSWLEYTEIIVSVMILGGVSCLMRNPSPLFAINGWIRESFEISANNYYVLFAMYSVILKPVILAASYHSKLISRHNEYEADRESVRQGYGEELIETFTKLSSDELVDVYPHPFVEWTQYTHPSMYMRISAIRNEMNKK